MKIRLRLGLLAAMVLGLCLSLAGAPLALATESLLSFDADTNISLSGIGGGTIFTIGSGSKAESLIVGTTNITVQLGNGGDTFTVKDTTASRRMLFLITPGSLVGTCSDTQSAYTIAANSATTTYTIEPRTDSTCTSSSPTGSGGSTSSSSSPPASPPASTPPASPPAAVQPPAGAHANGSLVLDPDGTISLVMNGKKRGFRNPEEYFSHGYKFEQAVPSTAEDRALPADTTPVAKALDGTLVLDKTDNRTIYMIADGKKRGFTSAEVFFSLGYKFDQAVPVDLSDYPADEPITTAEAAHPNGALVLDKNDNVTVWWILNGTRQGFQSAEVFYTYGFKFDKIVVANDTDMALPTGALVKFRDGTIVNDGGTYFLISDGLKKRFASVTRMSELGYSTLNAISASLTAYTEGTTIE